MDTKKLLAVIIAVFCAIYIVSPIDVMPEFALGPFGLIDDAAASAILMGALKYLGLDLFRFFSPKAKSDPKSNINIDI